MIDFHSDIKTILVLYYVKDKHYFRSSKHNKRGWKFSDTVVVKLLLPNFSYLSYISKGPRGKKTSNNNRNRFDSKKHNPQLLFSCSDNHDCPIISHHKNIISLINNAYNNKKWTSRARVKNTRLRKKKKKRLSQKLAKPTRALSISLTLI